MAGLTQSGRALKHIPGQEIICDLTTLPVTPSPNIHNNSHTILLTDVESMPSQYLNGHYKATSPQLIYGAIKT